MIKTTTIPFGNSIFCVAFFHEGFIKKTKSAWAADMFKAPGVCKRLEKEILRDKIIRFLNHRQNIMDNYGGLRTMDRYKAWETLKASFEFIKEKSLEDHCRFILIAKPDFEKLMPGEKSEYYAGNRKMLNEAYSFCEQKIKITERIKA